MAIKIATGTKISVAKTYGSSFNITAITNASEAVATLAVGHGVVVGEILEVTSGWGLLNARLVRAKTVATNDVTFEGIDTTSTTLYPAGTGTGSIRRITAWSQLSQIAAASSSGGDQQFADSSSLDDVDDKQIPSSRSAESLQLTIHDDPSLAWVSDVRTARDSGVAYGLYMLMPGGSKLYANAYWSLKETPGITRNETIKADVTLSYASRPTRYAT